MPSTMSCSVRMCQVSCGFQARPAISCKERTASSHGGLVLSGGPRAALGGLRPRGRDPPPRPGVDAFPAGLGAAPPWVVTRGDVAPLPAGPPHQPSPIVARLRLVVRDLEAAGE